MFRDNTFSYLFYIFFFSSRRRHTRLTCDWSSDVCSSDLPTDKEKGIGRPRGYRGGRFYRSPASRARPSAHAISQRRIHPKRSEERRVGKECRSGGAPYH